MRRADGGRGVLRVCKLSGQSAVTIALAGKAVPGTRRAAQSGSTTVRADNGGDHGIAITDV